MTTRPSPDQKGGLSRRQLELPPLEMWGGIECTVNRVRDRYVDQLALSGHCQREDDLERIAQLGIRTLRYPVLWEHVAPEGLDSADWSSSDRALAKMRELGIRPIVGLVHHGSGPRQTNLLDPDFAGRLREYALAVAARYPWVDAYSPINEPLTTARFSTLYGHWYPHARDDRSFARAVLNQCTAISSSMEVIRDVNTAAILVQTEDLGRTYSTPALRYQADFDNHRRWLTFDLLTGRVNEKHALWHFLIEAGLDRRELIALSESPCPPDIVGINYYLTSDRFLDHRSDSYPPAYRGGNGRDSYADVEAVRVLPDGIAGHRAVLAETAARYQLPLAITEVHLGCTREQQLRWLDEAWTAATDLRESGTDIRAVTAWALLGSFGWDGLLTGEQHSYECGAFDLRSSTPRPTAVARMIGQLATSGTFAHPVLHVKGWWRKPARIAYPQAMPTDLGLFRSGDAFDPKHHSAQKPLLVVGGSGTLGSAFIRTCLSRGLALVAPRRAVLDLCEFSSVEAAIREIDPWAVINASGYVRVDDAEWDSSACYATNTNAAVNLATVCARLRVPLLTYSSDLVFDGTARHRYLESAPVNPIGVYGRSKARAEEEILALDSAALIIRTSAFFGPWDGANFLTQSLDSIASGIPVNAASDVRVSPTYVPDLVAASLDLLIDGERGIWHLANQSEVSWADFAKAGAIAAGLSPDLVVEKPMAQMGFVAPRPAFSALASERGAVMPALDDALDRYLAERTESRTAAASARG